MIIVELDIPTLVYDRIRHWWKDVYRDEIIEVTRSSTSRIVRIFIKETPRGWWLAMRLVWQGTSRLYIAKEISFPELPHQIVGSGSKKWSPELEQNIIEGIKRHKILIPINPETEKCISEDL